jgi:hypothetical protein
LRLGLPLCGCRCFCRSLPFIGSFDGSLGALLGDLFRQFDCHLFVVALQTVSTLGRTPRNWLTHKIRPEEADGSLCVECIFWLGRRGLDLLDLFKVLLDTRQLLDNGMVLGVYAVEAKRSCGFALEDEGLCGRDGWLTK